MLLVLSRRTSDFKHSWTQEFYFLTEVIQITLWKVQKSFKGTESVFVPTCTRLKRPRPQVANGMNFALFSVKRSSLIIFLTAHYTVNTIFTGSKVAFSKTSTVCDLLFKVKVDTLINFQHYAPYGVPNIILIMSFRNLSGRLYKADTVAT